MLFPRQKGAVLLCMLCYWTAVCAKKKDLVKNAQDLLDKEIQECKRLCGTSKLTKLTLDEMRVDQKTKAEKVICCHIKYLGEDPLSNDAGWIWSALGHLYAPTSKSASTTCFKQASKISGKLTNNIALWHFLGPFVIGKIEVDGDPVEQYGGIQQVSTQRYQKKKKYISELADKGEISWQVVQNSGGNVQIMPQIDWNDLVRSLGSMGITEWQGWLVAEFAVNDNNVNVMIQCHGVHTIYVDNLPVAADLYRRDQYWFPVPLSKGVHTIYIRARATANGVFKCELANAKSSFEILKPSFLPHLLDGYLFSEYVTLPISNLQTSKWLKINHISVTEQSEGNPLSAKLQEESVSLAPGQTRMVNIRLSAEEDQIISACTSTTVLYLKLKVSTSDGHVIYPLSLHCRKRHESFLFTFLDHDGSVQHGAAIEPLEDCSDSRPILLTLHGTTVPPQNQADSYKHMENGQFVFGLEKAWVLAPTRHGAHNWEGPGALTALTAADRLQDLLQSKAWLGCKAHAQHLIVAGHSMGGHGAWHIATHYPDRTLALIPLAGWIKKEEYGDSNLFFRHDISTSSTDPAIKAVLEATIAENEADRHVSNLKGIPILARIGSNDRTIHPYFVRRMYRLLQQENISATYVELPGKEHWWWDTRETNDGGCVNDKQLRDFTNAHSEIPDENGSCEEVDGKTLCDTEIQDMYKELQDEQFMCVVVNPAFGGSMRGVHILRQLTPHTTSSVQVACSGTECSLLTTNVQHFSISEVSGKEMGWTRRTLKVDGQQLEDLKIPAQLLKTKGVWKVYENNEAPNKRPLAQLGPARRVAELPFLIVIGSKSPHTALLQASATYLSNQFLLTSDTNAPVVLDTNVDATMKEAYNLIILGGPQENLLAEEFLEHLPIRVETTGLSLGSCNFTSQNTGGVFLSPNGRSRLALVLLGNTEHALQDVVSLGAPTIPPMARSPFSNLIPDYVITGPLFRQRGPGGYLCAGFWGHSWNLTAELSSCSYCA